MNPRTHGRHITDEPGALGSIIARIPAGHPLMCSCEKCLAIKFPDEDDSAILAKALLAVVNATREYLPPDGIDAKECLNRILEATDNPEINPIIRRLEWDEPRPLYAAPPADSDDTFADDAWRYGMAQKPASPSEPSPARARVRDELLEIACTAIEFDNDPIDGEAERLVWAFLEGLIARAPDVVTRGWLIGVKVGEL